MRHKFYKRLSLADLNLLSALTSNSIIETRFRSLISFQVLMKEIICPILEYLWLRLL